MAKADVASATQEAAHHVRQMAMIDAKPLEGFPLADRAGALLAGQHPVIILHGEPVSGLELAFRRTQA
jgi:hypothetical protein